MKRISRLLVTMLVAFPLAAALPTPSYAMTGSVNSGGAIAGTSTDITFLDLVTGKTVTCTGLSVAGTLPNTTSLGNPIGHQTSMTLSGCTGGTYTFTYVMVTFPTGGQTISVTGSTTGGITDLDISSIHIEFRTNPSTNCDFILAGDPTGSTTNGVAHANYSDFSGYLDFSDSGHTDTLYSHVISGCSGLASTGDHWTMSGVVKLRNSSNGIPQIQAAYP